MAESTLTAAPSSVSIQPATWRDLNAVRSLEKRCFPLDAWPLWDMLGALSFPGMVRLKAVDGEDLVGFILGDTRRPQRLAWVATICVHPDYQGRGIGAALLESCENKIGLPRIRLTVRASNQRAIRLYQRLGYEPVGEWPRYYKGGEDGIVMEKSLE